MSEFHVHLVTDGVLSVHKGFQSKAFAINFTRSQIKSPLDTSVLIEDTGTHLKHPDFLKRFKVLLRIPENTKCWLDPEFYQKN